MCGIFPDQGSNLCVLHWQVDSSPLSHQGSPRVLSALRNFEAMTLGHFGVKSDIEGHEGSLLCGPPLLCFADTSIRAAGFLFSLRISLLTHRDGEFGLDTGISSIFPYPLGPGFITAQAFGSWAVFCFSPSPSRLASSLILILQPQSLPPCRRIKQAAWAFPSASFPHGMW